MEAGGQAWVRGARTRRRAAALALVVLLAGCHGSGQTLSAGTAPERPTTEASASEAPTTAAPTTAALPTTAPPPTAPTTTTPTTTTPPTTARPTTMPTTTTAGPTTTVATAADVIARSTVPVLCYHQIRDWTADDSPSARAYITPPATFRAQLDALVANGYTSINPDQLVAHLTSDAPLPPKPVMLTFDDGNDDDYAVTLPELQARGLTATFFPMTVVLGKPNYVSTDQVRALAAAGMTIGAHTWDHHRVDRYTGDDWTTQVVEPAQKLAEIIGQPIRYFAYPYGAWSPDAFPHLQQAGYAAAFQLTGKPMDATNPLLTIRRKIVDPTWSIPELLASLTTGFSA